MCDCHHPARVVVADVYLSAKLSSGVWRVRRYYDCLFCGPHAEITFMDRAPPAVKGLGVPASRGPTRLYPPSRWVSRARRRKS